MRLDSIFEQIIIMSGQFLINTNRIELDETKFINLVEHVLGTYSKHVPYSQHFFVDIYGTRMFRFDDSVMPMLTGKEYLGAPDWISDIMPSRLMGISPTKLFNNLNPNYNSDLLDKTQLPFQYRKPDLYVSISAQWDVHGVWKHRVFSSQTEDGFIYEVPTISMDDTLFFKLLKGHFLESIGRSRRAFTLNDLPLAMDAVEVASEGQEIIKDAMEEIEDHQRFHLAWGG